MQKSRFATKDQRKVVRRWLSDLPVSCRIALMRNLFKYKQKHAVGKEFTRYLEFDQSSSLTCYQILVQIGIFSYTRGRL